MFKEDLDSIVKRYIDEEYFPSAVVRVFNADNIYYEEAFGDVNTNTLFDVASLTKIVTSTIVLSLIDEGKLELDSKIGDILHFLSEYDGFTKRHLNITIKQLLIHNAGLVDWHPIYAETGNFFKILNKIVKTYDWVEETEYSDINFMLLGEIIKYVTNKDLEQCLEEYIKKPLGIENMYFNPVNKTNIAPSSYGNDIEENMCKERNIVFNKWRSKEKELIGEVNDGNSYYFFNGVSGHAGIFADVDAYARIANMYLSTENELFLESMKNQGGDRGLGWQISEEMFPGGCGHTGFTGTSIWICKEKNIGAVMFTNRLMANGKGQNTNPFRREMHNYIYKNI